jgi:hypothetical protein
MDAGEINCSTSRVNGPGYQLWLGALIIGLAYSVVGVAFGAQPGTIWRLAAWVISGLIYATHISYEHFRLRNSPFSIALHVGVAVAIGAFGLAIAATVHALSIEQFRPRYLIALVAWPAITAFPAVLVALSVGAVLTRLARH